ncbi:uncharacterized protein LOC129596737 isoform X2 [Paramacrobiotus metropolitanus]|uniref:uncharacterized protein LOC129596737 isoform X2 n=1 Tax=Paramacrobiotus metropolitanus TaxID=2943436 RepID=UPI00244656C0|nr:uncharacterized protein LOC129596737 isoform X2 [Paramacrobiotus metropolitanus]
MFRKDIWRYGAVTVKTEQDELWHGLVADVNSKHGLTVNFGCPQFQAALVPWANFVQGRTWTPESRLQFGGPALAVYQLTRNVPWRWHRACLLAGSSDYKYAFVELILTDGTVVRDVVGWERVQPLAEMPSCQWDKAPHKAPFKKCWIELTGDPQLLAVTQRPDFVEHWLSRTGTIARGMRGRSLLCLATSKEIPRLFARESEIAQVLSWIGQAELKARWSRSRQANSVNGTDTSPSPGHTIAIDANCESYTQQLPVEVWARIFSFLNAYERVTASEICYTWNRLLKSPPLAVRVEIDLDQHRGVTVAGMVHHMIMPSTKTLLLTSSDDERRLKQWPRDSPLPSPLHIVVDVLRAKNLRVPRIVLKRCRIRKHSLLGTANGRSDMAALWCEVLGEF